MREYFHDYGALIAPAAAIINGFIAVLIAQFFKDRPIARIVLVVSAGILGTAAIGATFYSQHQIVAAAKAEKAHIATIKEGLGSFIEEGKRLKDQCEDANVPLPTDAVNDWNGRVVTFFRKNLDASYVSRFSDPTGALPPTVGGPVERRGLWLGMYVRVFRLEQFSQQLPLS